MSRSVNVCTFSGYLAADPKIHEFDNGDKVANLRLAVNNSKKVDGEFVDAAIFIDVKAYGGMVDAIGQWTIKGSFVMVTGRLSEPRTWDADDGTTRFTMVVDHAQVTFGPRTDGVNGGQQAPAQQAPAPQAPRAAVPAKSALADDDSSIPF
jgi:single-strand DNA-binding protein